MLDNFPQLAKDYFEDNREAIKTNGSGVFLVRPDGVPIYHHSSFAEDINEASVGALLGGVWQAAKALSSFIPNENSSEAFRLSFDTSSKGVYILPVTVGVDEYFLGIIYFNEVNPGLVKSRLRNFVSSFNNYVEQSLINITPEVSEEIIVRDESLFKNITDDEMDNLFSF